MTQRSAWNNKCHAHGSRRAAPWVEFLEFICYFSARDCGLLFFLVCVFVVGPESGHDVGATTAHIYHANLWWLCGTS